MSRSKQTSATHEEKPTDHTRQTSHTLALEQSDPPLGEFGVWRSVVELATDSIEHAVTEEN